VGEPRQEIFSMDRKRTSDKEKATGIGYFFSWKILLHIRFLPSEPVTSKRILLFKSIK
jgi:hypothetical protein